MSLSAFLDAEHMRTDQPNATFEPQRQSNGILVFPNLADKIMFYGGGGFLSPYSFTKPTDTQALTMSIESFTLPSDSNNIIEIPWNNETKKFAGKNVVDDIDVSVRLSCDPDVMDILQAWRDLVYDPISGKVNWAYKYKTLAYAILYPPDADDGLEPTLHYSYFKLLGCFPSRLARGDVDHAADDVVRATLTMSVDKVLPKKSDAEAARTQKLRRISIQGVQAS